MVEVNKKPKKLWADCSIRERRLIDLLLKGVAPKKIVDMGLYKYGTIRNKKSELKDAMADRMAYLDSQRVAQVNDVLGQLSDIALNLHEDKTSDRLKALELMAKYHGMFVDKIEISEAPKIQIEVLEGRENNEDSSS